ncbi:hypothetical protein [Sinorhizobium alkalisoli]|uniref:hypothetical protein n=1 Tax=Sinorhizobium alkalisoli TaxID=1752398 RepID=UPI00124F1F75|nr:hypothetical protein [Sinorhizobium alkalisoli]MCA1491843.1 hypothetical protein [Ensifer sp. NBAIM29]QFI66853.1 hypothetical protein EKH55_1979 [Sinorhizobium alkalisoli]
MANIRAFADQECADYQFLSGNIFSPKFSPPLQKLVMLDKKFDHYDVVVMLDMDMFVRKGMTESLFEQPGIGVSAPDQRRLKWAYIRKMKGLVHWRYPYWSGCLWKLDRSHRQLFRSKLHLVDIEKYNRGRLEDEGVMHQLARHSRFTGRILPGGDKWGMSSWQDNLEKAAMIHIRPRVSTIKGAKRTKIENLRELVDRGLIAG